MRLPWSFAHISTLPLRQTPTQLYVVPRSMPMQGPSIGSSDAPPRRRRTGAAVRRPRGVSRAVVVARSALKSALLLRRTMVSYVCAYELAVCCTRTSWLVAAAPVLSSCAAFAAPAMMALCEKLCWYLCVATGRVFCSPLPQSRSTMRLTKPLPAPSGAKFLWAEACLRG